MSQASPSIMGGKRSQLDYTLPPAFLRYISIPLEDAVSQLVPLSKQPTSPPKGTSTSSKTGIAFVDAMMGTADARTANGAYAHSSTDSALVDLWNDLSPGKSNQHIRDLLDKAWAEDPVATIKIVFHARSIHEGKGFKEGFFVAMGWLWDKHPRTVLSNLHLIVDPTCERHRNAQRDEEKAAKNASAGKKGSKTVIALDDDAQAIERLNLDDLPKYPPRPHGSYNDLVDLLVLAISGQLNATFDGKLTAIDETFQPAHVGKYYKAVREKQGLAGNKKAIHSHLAKTRKAANNLDQGSFAYKLARVSTKAEKHKLLHARVDEQLGKDKKLQALYLMVLRLFVETLKNDLTLLARHNDFSKKPLPQRAPFGDGSSPHLFGMSYAAKWVPTPAHGADRQTHFTTAVAMMMFPGVEVNWARQRLQQEILSPLRKVLNVPESSMVKGPWKIDYTKVPARCMARNSRNFLRHDPAGFKAYLTKVAEGRYAVAGATMMPHELLLDAIKSDEPIVAQLADLQWKSLVQSIASSSGSKLSNCMAIADVSGSMGGFGSYGAGKKMPTPLTVCIALTMLLCDLAAPPWNGCFFTFSSDPSLQTTDKTKSLQERARALNSVDWGMTTNFYKVFNLILVRAKAEKLRPDQMVKKLFIFSDMQFNQAADGLEHETEHAAIKRKFADAGYELPELVYWDLLSYDLGPEPTKAAQADEGGVTLMSGFSGALMKMFLAQQADEDEDERILAAVSEWEELEDTDNNPNALGGAIRGGPDVGKAVEAKATVEKKKANPLDAVMRVIGTAPFQGVVVVD